MSDLAKKSCVPCKGGVPPLTGGALTSMLKQVDGWEADKEHHIGKTFTFPDFAKALEFTNQVGEIAEREGHHPDIHLTWGRVGIEIWTHKIDGLTESDFVLAAKIDGLMRS